MDRLYYGLMRKLLINTDKRNWFNRCLSLSSVQYFKSSQLVINECKPNERKQKPEWAKLVFGQSFNDHMFEVDWNSVKGWGTPTICPVHNFSLHPSAKVFHYAQELFEGMKAYRGVDGKIRLFRPELNMKRMKSGAQRMNLPDFDEEELLKCLKILIQIDDEWVPPMESKASIYIRPTFIATEAALGVSSSKDAKLYIIAGPVGPYFSTGAVKPIALLADPQYVRAWPGGVGDKKLGSNYAPTLSVQKQAEKLGLQQVLWLFGSDHQLTEAGTMNIFVFCINEKGEKQLITPPIKDGLILPGVTRISLIEMAQNWNEFQVIERTITMSEIKKMLNEKRLLEMFGAGTACVVCPVGKIHYANQELIIPTMNESESLTMKMLKTLTDIHYGKIEHDWTVII